MNCRDFNDSLHDYLDGELEPRVQSSIREHLQHCGECRRALGHEEAVVQSLRDSFEHSTAGVSLNPETSRKILQAGKSSSRSANAFSQAWRWLCSAPLRPIGAGAALLIVSLGLLAMRLHHWTREGPGPRAVIQTSKDTWEIDVPIYADSHAFRRQGDTVVDGIYYSLALGQARFVEPKH